MPMSLLTLKLLLEPRLAMEKMIRYKATDWCYPGWQEAFIKASSFLALGSSKETHTTRLGHETQILQGCWYTRPLFLDRSNSDQNGEWDFPCIGYNTYVCSRKKSWSKKAWMSAAKEKPICASYSDRLFREFILKVQLPPKAWPRSVSICSVPTIPATSAQMWTTQGICLLGELGSTRLASSSVWIPPSSLFPDTSVQWAAPQQADLGLILFHWIHCYWVGVGRHERRVDFQRTNNPQWWVRVWASGARDPRFSLCCILSGTPPAIAISRWDVKWPIYLILDWKLWPGSPWDLHVSASWGLELQMCATMPDLSNVGPGDESDPYVCKASAEPCPQPHFREF